MSKITVVSLAWNKYEMTERFLRRLKEYTDIPFDLVFTDNGSEEDIVGLVKRYFPDVDLIAKKENVGCPRTRNEQVRHVKTDITVFLDNDTMVGPKWYVPMLNKLEDPSIGISGPTGCVVRKPWDSSHPFEPIESGDCDYFVGYAMAMKTKAYRPINDYNIPVNLDDVEICFGVKESGYRAVISEPCFLNHLTSQTERGWEKESPMDKFWLNWKEKTHLFERWK